MRWQWDIGPIVMGIRICDRDENFDEEGTTLVFSADIWWDRGDGISFTLTIWDIDVLSFNFFWASDENRATRL